MKIKVKYFASFRELAGKSEEEITLNEANLSHLFDELSKKYNFSMKKSDVKVALNQSYVDWDAKVKELDTIVFIPPVAGG